MKKILSCVFIGAFISGYIFKKYVDSQIKIDINEYFEKNANKN